MVQATSTLFQIIEDEFDKVRPVSADETEWSREYSLDDMRMDYQVERVLHAFQILKSLEGRKLEAVTIRRVSYPDYHGEIVELIVKLEPTTCQNQP